MATVSAGGHPADGSAPPTLQWLPAPLLPPPPPHFSGFLLAKIPVYFIWINKISFLTYAYARLLQSELQGLQVANPADPDGPWVSASTLLPSAINNGEEHLVCSRGAVCAKL